MSDLETHSKDQAFLNSIEFDEKTLVLKPSTETDSKDGEDGRVSSSQRMKYEAEVNLIKKRWGTLEEMRQGLGLSQRKMAQLLMVDPSAWTRWTREGSTDAPPHIYRALGWYLLLQEKHPEMSPYQWLQGVARPQLPETEMRSLKSRLSQEIRFQLKEETQKDLRKGRELWVKLFLAQGLIFFLLFVVFAKLLKS